MSASLATKPATAAQRTKSANDRAAAVIHAEDSARFNAALAEIAAEEIERNPGFRLRVQSRYEESLSTKSAKKTTGTSATSKTAAKKTLSDFTIIRHVPGRSFNIAEARDPYVLYEAYGPEQFRGVLECYTAKELMASAEIVLARKQGTSLKKSAKKPEIIDFLVKHVS